jgi:hypothetical protein
MVETSLIWVGFKELLVDRFTPEYQEVREEMNLVQKHTRSLKAYVCDSNIQMNVTSKMNKFAKKCIFLGGFIKVGGGCFVQVRKAFQIRGGDYQD